MLSSDFAGSSVSGSNPVCATRICPSSENASRGAIRASPAPQCYLARSPFPEHEQVIVMRSPIALRPAIIARAGAEA